MQINSEIKIFLCHGDDLVNLTPEQNLAVSVRDKNLLVSAAAGSGKTKVLVERVKKLILEDNFDVDRLLIVTFTNAAAHEMKIRIRAALNEQLNKENDFETSRRLEKQIVLLSNASITTMHSFCQNLIKRNFVKIGIDPKFRVADENELEMLKETAIIELFEKNYSNGDESFKKFTDDFGGTSSSDEKVHEIILSLHKFAQSQIFPNQWLESLKENFNINENSKLENTIWYSSAMKNIGFAINAAYDECKSTLDFAREKNVYVENIEDDFNEIFVPLKNNSQDWNKIYEILNRDKLFKKLSGKKNMDDSLKKIVQSRREDYKKIIDDLHKKFFFTSEQNMIDDLREIKSSMEILIDLTIEFDKAFNEAKREKNIIDFNDMEHFAVEILQDEKITKSLRKKFQAVMVDEYQDTNAVQEKIFSSIADKNKSNFFAVGDVKQSIYKFRLADPSLFMDKYKNYPLLDDCMRIDLSKNFRSRPQVLNAINFIFERLMNSESMEIDYSEDARLNNGFNYPESNKNLLDTPTEFFLIESNDTNENSDSESLKDIERETQIIATRIKKMFVDKIQIYDTNEEKYRDVKFSDIVILRRTQKDPAAMMEILQRNNIPSYSMGDETYFQKTEIKIMMSLLTILENMRQDIPLAAVMLSEIGGFTAEELAKLKIASKSDDLCTLLTVAASSSEEFNLWNLPKDLIEKSLKFLNKINSWREIAGMLSVAELLEKIYNETGYYKYVGGLENGPMRQANLRMLIDRAVSYNAAGFRGISKFLKYISKIKELTNDLSTPRTLSENEDVVRIMTIHKSKGLEFPIVFVCELGKKFNLRDEQSEIVLKHKEFGIGSYKILKNEPIRIPTFARTAIATKNINEQKAEELRILYVAMTRAREKLILIGTSKNLKYEKYNRYGSLEKIPNFALLSANTFLEWLIAALSKKNDCVKTINCNASKIKIENETIEEEKEYIDADMSKLERKIPTSAKKNIPSKMSVTELKRRIESDDEIEKNLIEEKISTASYKRPNFETEKKLSGAEYGTLMHALMQRIDLNGDLSTEGINLQIKKLIEKKIFTIEQAKVIKSNKAAQFFASLIGKRMISSKEIYRELPFGRLIDAAKFFPNINADEKIFIQGIIDVLFKDENGNYILIDYKTDRVDDTELMIEKYKLQIEIYAEAIEAILNRKIDEKYLYMLGAEKLIRIEN